MIDKYDLNYISTHSYILSNFLSDLIKVCGNSSDRINHVIAEVERILRESEQLSKKHAKSETQTYQHEQNTVDKIYISQKEASRRYGLSRQWFERKRWAGGGPSYIKIGGRVLYNLNDTDVWFANHGRKHNTSEYIK